MRRQPGSDEELEDAPQTVGDEGIAMRPMVPEEAALQMDLSGGVRFYLDAESDPRCGRYRRTTVCER